jgi:hypothetical protein
MSGPVWGLPNLLWNPGKDLRNNLECRAPQASTSEQQKHNCQDSTISCRKTPIGDEPDGEVAALDILEGRTLQVAAKWIVNKGITLCGRPTCSGAIKVGSLCSGSEMLSVALGALTDEFVEQRIPVTFTTVMVCEVDQKKRFSPKPLPMVLVFASLHP